MTYHYWPLKYECASPTMDLALYNKLLNIQNCPFFKPSTNCHWLLVGSGKLFRQVGGKLNKLKHIIIYKKMLLVWGKSVYKQFKVVSRRNGSNKASGSSCFIQIKNWPLFTCYALIGLFLCITHMSELCEVHCILSTIYLHYW